MARVVTFEESGFKLATKEQTLTVGLQRQKELSLQD